MTLKHFDDVLERLKTGKWNYLYFATIGAFCFTIPGMVIGGAFLAPKIIHNCTEYPSDVGGLSAPVRDLCRQSFNVTTHDGSIKTETEECQAWEYDTKQFTVTLTSEFNLVCDRAYLRPTFQTVYMLGNFFGSPIWGFSADAFGRKRIFTIGAIGLITLNIISSIMNQFSFILLLRFFIGMCHPAIVQSGMVLAMEACEHRHRSTVGMLISIPWAFGTMWFGCLGYLIRDWRWLQRSIIVPAILATPLLMLIDESPRWLIVKGRHEEALKALRKAANRNGSSLPSDVEMRESMLVIQKAARSTEKEKVKLGKKTVLKFTKDKLDSAVTLFKTPELRKRTLLIYYVFFVSSTVFYGLSLNAVNFNVDPYLYMFIGGVIEVPAYALPVPIIQKFGRVRPLVSSYFICGIAIMALAFISGDLRWLVITFAMTGRLCIAAAYQLVYLCSTEVFPTEVRTQALGTASFVSRIGSMLAPYITDSIGFDMKWLPSIIFGGLSLSGGVVAWFIPETLKCRLYDIVEQMEIEYAKKKKPSTTKDSDMEIAVNHVTNKDNDKSPQSR